MRFIQNRIEPEFWTEYKKTHPKDKYDDLGKTSVGIQIRQAMREHLVISQNYLCAYCCKQINTDSALNEHIKPKGVPKYVHFSMEYDNLVASCKTEGSDATCGAKKENRYDEKRFVSPLQNDCADHFSFSMNGEIIGTTDNGKYMIDLLKLNSYRLKQARAAKIRACIDYHDKELIKEYFLTPDCQGKLSSFADMILWFYEKGYFT